MKIPRRQFLRLAAIAIGLPAVSRMANAQAYPTLSSVSPLAVHPTSRGACWRIGCPNGSASSSSLRTVQAPAAISPPKP
jgi:hypothetical protein